MPRNIAIHRVMKIFLLMHCYTDEDHSDSKFIGIFPSYEAAQAVIPMYRKLPGFRVWPHDFIISEWELDSPAWTQGFTTPEDHLAPYKGNHSLEAALPEEIASYPISSESELPLVYELSHEYEREIKGHFVDFGKIIGFFSSEDKAKEALVKYRQLPGFCDWPDGFTICRAPMGETTRLGFDEGFSYPDPNPETEQ